MNILQKGFAHLFLIVVIVLVGLGGLLYYSWQKGLITTNTQPEIMSPTLVSEPTPTPYEVAENGVYTNHMARFRFKYPNDIFTFTGNEVFISRERETDPSKYSGYPGKYTMYLNVNDANLGVQDPDGNLVPFSDYVNMSLDVPLYNTQQENDHNTNHLKVKSINNNNLEGYIIYGYNTPYSDGIEPTVFHRADLLHEDLLISLNIVSPSGFEGETAYKSERLKILEDIINSIEFF